MPSLISTNVAEVVLTFSDINSDIFENVFFVHKATAWDATTLSELVNAFVSWESDTGSAERGDQVTLVRVTATDLTSLTTDRVDAQLETPVPGQRTSPVLPSNVTLAIKKNIGSRGKGRNGRIFWIGLTEDAVEQNAILEARANLLITALAALEPVVQAAVSGTLVGIIHTVIDGVPQPDAPFSHTQNYAITDFIVDSQRDRLPGHKRHKKPASP